MKLPKPGKALFMEKAEGDSMPSAFSNIIYL